MRNFTLNEDENEEHDEKEEWITYININALHYLRTY